MQKILKLFIAGLILTTGVLMSEAKSASDPNAANYTQVHAAHILVDTKSQANAVKYRVEGGEDFAKVAKQFSKCPSGQRGGDLGYFGRGQMAQEFETAAFDLPKGQVSEPVQTDFGWHIIKVIDKK